MLLAPISMPKCNEGVFGQACSPKDASAQLRHSTRRWPTAVLRCPLSIIGKNLPTRVERKPRLCGFHLRVSRSFLRTFWFDSSSERFRHTVKGATIATWKLARPVGAIRRRLHRIALQLTGRIGWHLRIRRRICRLRVVALSTAPTSPAASA